MNEVGKGVNKEGNGVSRAGKDASGQGKGVNEVMRCVNGGRWGGCE